jgi:hypothetical protein
MRPWGCKSNSARLLNADGKSSIFDPKLLFNENIKKVKNAVIKPHLNLSVSQRLSSCEIHHPCSLLIQTAFPLGNKIVVI